MMGEIQQFIWEYFAVKRSRFYLAGLFIGMFGPVPAAMHDPEHGFPLWSLAGGAALGVGAVWLLSFAERLQARLHQARAEGNPTWPQQVLFALLGLIALIVVALLVAGVCLYFL